MAKSQIPVYPFAGLGLEKALGGMIIKSPIVKLQKNVTPVSKYGCISCPKKVFASKHELKKHLRTHSFPCNVCGKTFESTTDLQLHATAHLIGKVLSCLSCQYSTSEKRDLRIHAKRFRHEICDDRCSFTLDSMENCKRKHKTQVEIPQCKACNKKFGSFTALEEHQANQCKY